MKKIIIFVIICFTLCMCQKERKVKIVQYYDGKWHHPTIPCDSVKQGCRCYWYYWIDGKKDSINALILCTAN